VATDNRVWKELRDWKQRRILCASPTSGWQNRPAEQTCTANWTTKSGRQGHRTVVRQPIEFRRVVDVSVVVFGALGCPEVFLHANAVLRKTNNAVYTAHKVALSWTGRSWPKSSKKSFARPRTGDDRFIANKAQLTPQTRGGCCASKGKARQLRLVSGCVASLPGHCKTTLSDCDVCRRQVTLATCVILTAHCSLLRIAVNIAMKILFLAKQHGKFER